MQCWVSLEPEIKFLGARLGGASIGAHEGMRCEDDTDGLPRFAINIVHSMRIFEFPIAEGLSINLDYLK